MTFSHRQYSAMDKIIRGYFLLPLFYLTMTSGLPPGPKPKSMEVTSNNSTQSIIIDTLQEIISTTVGSKNLADTTTAWTSISTSTISSEPIKEMSTMSATGLSNTNSIDSSTSTTSTSTDSDTRHDDMHHSTIDTPVLAPLVQNTTKVPLRGKCNHTRECIGDFTDCRNNVCKCMPGYLPRIDNGDLCGDERLHRVELPKADPTMIGVVIGLALMSVTLCVVLRLFAKARFRENRTIFNTPNPRLMNVSLLKGGSKTLLRGNSAPRSRRGSTASARSGIDVGTPTSPMNEHVINGHHDSGNGNAIPLVGASSRPKPSRQMSTDNVGESTPNTNRAATAVNKQKFRHQDSVASNV